MIPSIEDVTGGSHKGCAKDNRDRDANGTMDGKFQKPKHEGDGHDAASQPKETGEESNPETQEKGQRQRNRRIILGFSLCLPLEKHLYG